MQIWYKYLLNKTSQNNKFTRFVKNMKPHAIGMVENAGTG